jgi:3-oxoacyl-[acyl-carrier protein] reductase
MNRLDFANRAAVVTGGAAASGSRSRSALPRVERGVALWDRDAGALDAAKSAVGDDAITFALDVSDAATVDRAASKTA